MSFERPDNFGSYMAESALTPRVESFSEAVNHVTEALKPAKFEEFTGVYPQEEINRDRLAVREVSEKFTKYSGEWSELSTRVILEGIYNQGWLQPDDPDWEVHVEVANRYDDVMRKVDLIIAFVNPTTNSELLLMLDTTTSKNIEDKKKRIIEDIKQGHLRKIKYYKSPKTGKAVGRREGVAAIAHYSKDDLADMAEHFKYEKDEMWNNPDLSLENLLRQELVGQIDEQIDIAYESLDDEPAMRLAGRLEQMRTLLVRDEIEKRATA